MAEEMIRPDMEEDLTITLSLEDGDIECDVMYQGQEVDYWIYRYHEENGEPVLECIEDEQEYEIAADAFDEYLDTLDFDALLGSDDE